MSVYASTKGQFLNCVWEKLDKFVFMFNNAVQLSFFTYCKLLNIICNAVHILLPIYCIVLFLFQTCKFFL